MTAVLALLLALQQAPAPAAPKPVTPATPATQGAPAQPAVPPAAPPGAAAPQRRPAPTSITLTVHVTNRAGAAARDVAVTAEGPVTRDGVTDAAGQALLRTVSNGTYRIRASGEKFITLEKEVVVRTGAPAAPVEMTLSAAPPPPAPPPAPEPEPKPAPHDHGLRRQGRRIACHLDCGSRRAFPERPRSSQAGAGRVFRAGYHRDDCASGNAQRSAEPERRRDALRRGGRGAVVARWTRSDDHVRLGTRWFRAVRHMS